MVAGRYGAANDVIKAFSAVETVHNIAVLGLYPDFANNVEVTIQSATGQELGRRS